MRTALAAVAPASTSEAAAAGSSSAGTLTACAARTTMRSAKPPGRLRTPVMETRASHRRSSPARQSAQLPQPVKSVIATRAPSQARSASPAATTRPTGSWPSTNGSSGA